MVPCLICHHNLTIPPPTPHQPTYHKSSPSPPAIAAGCTISFCHLGSRYSWTGSYYHPFSSRCDDYCGEDQGARVMSRARGRGQELKEAATMTSFSFLASPFSFSELSRVCCCCFPASAHRRICRQDLLQDVADPCRISEYFGPVFSVLPFTFPPLCTYLEVRCCLRAMYKHK